MSERLAVVTGGTRGIGAEISKVLKSAGYKIAAIYHGNTEAAQKLQSETGIHPFKVDVSDEVSVNAGMEEIVKTLGPVDILINNAGITKDGMFHKMSAKDWHDVMETNLTSCFLMTRTVIDGMRERQFGRIVNISSINGQKGQLGQTNYAAAKAGIIGFTKALALENARKGITVNAVAPGYIETDMVKAVSSEVLDKIIGQIPVGRLGQPKEIAEAVKFLVSDHAGFITGSTLSINGGQYLV
ncbi:MAG: acetoacetyl-CoA reductase [Caedimonadaceae bacterium]|nr:MAG: acetoacetyl-CoA reductase [Caedimonadaceae bacterium]